MSVFKKYHRFIAVFALLFLLQLVLPIASQAAAITVTIYFGKPPDCTGRGFCKITIGWNAAAPSEGAGNERKVLPKPPRLIEGSATLKENKLFVDLKSALPERASVIPIDENLALDAKTAKAFGAKSLTVLRGEYKVDYSKNKFGSIVLNLETRN